MTLFKNSRLIRKSLSLLATGIGITFFAMADPVEFPIKVSSNSRYFTDQKNSPFFIQADTPWSLFVALDLKETEQYFKNRQEKGFNTITVNLIEHWFKAETLAYPAASMPVPEQCLRNYAKLPVMPTILFETCYENEHNATAGKIRAQMYWGWLCSIAGMQFGNLPLWRFGQGWQSAMDWQGSWDASLMKKLVDSRNWYKLVPDRDHKILFDGYGSEEGYVSAAMAENGETLIAYIPKGNTVSVNMQQLSGNRLLAWWYNPRNGLAQKAGDYSEKNKIQFTPPDGNDWVLVIDDAAYNFGIPGTDKKLKLKDKN